jgi:phosphate transport system permease protein
VLGGIYGYLRRTVTIPRLAMVVAALAWLIVTGVLLAVARIAGETAPLLLTALGNLFFSTDLLKPVSALPLQIYQYAASPYDDWHTKAWGSSLVLVGVIALLSLSLRLAIRRGAR